MLSCCLHSQNRSRSWLGTSKAQHKICRQKQIAHHIGVSPCRGPSDRDASDTLGIISWKQRDKTGLVPRPTMNTTIPKPSDCTHQKSFVSGTRSHCEVSNPSPLIPAKLTADEPFPIRQPPHLPPLILHVFAPQVLLKAGNQYDSCGNSSKTEIVAVTSPQR